MQPTHVVLSTSSDALKGFEGHLRESHAAADIQLLRFSKDKAWDERKLEEALGKQPNCVVWILLLATGSESYLWFNAEHFPTNVRLCSWLRNEAGIEPRYVICPTDSSARAAWPDMEPRPPPILREIFGDFLPKDSEKVLCWRGFRSDVPSTCQVLDVTQAAVMNGPARAISKEALQRKPAWTIITCVLLISVGLAWYAREQKIMDLKKQLDVQEALFSKERQELRARVEELETENKQLWEEQLWEEELYFQQQPAGGYTEEVPTSKLIRSCMAAVKGACTSSCRPKLRGANAACPQRPDERELQWIPIFR